MPITISGIVFHLNTDAITTLTIERKQFDYDFDSKSPPLDPSPEGFISMVINWQGGVVGSLSVCRHYRHLESGAEVRPAFKVTVSRD